MSKEGFRKPPAEQWRGILPLFCILALIGPGHRPAAGSPDMPGAGDRKSGHGDSARPDAASSRTFPIPIWHPDARWEVEFVGGSAAKGHLDGPTRETEFYAMGLFGPGYYNMEGGRYYYGRYDPATRTAFGVAGSARGYLDGPFSRARFGGWDYGFYPHTAASPDGRYLYATDKVNGKILLRRLDFEKQEVRTVADIPGYLGLAADSRGQLYVLTRGGVFVLDPEGKKIKTQPVDLSPVQVDSFQRFSPLALDEVHNRLYASLGSKSWYVHYWDLKDGSFHGVVPILGQRRPRNQPGSFEGVDLYYEAGRLAFSVDDPNRRFLYMTRVDTHQMFRLDLEKRQIAALLVEGGGNTGKPQTVRFVETGPATWAPPYALMRWDGHDFMAGDFPFGLIHRFRRIR
jgi:hypothetical protein